MIRTTVYYLVRTCSNLWLEPVAHTWQVYA